MQESGLTGIIPLLCTLAVWGQFLVLTHPDLLFLRAHCREWLQYGAARWLVFFQSSLGAH